ncbi:MAG: hypothetical protein IJ606_01890 [Bacteroidaceae bacterium]|nr:hypothetical protein [Bacteroidaceae bacterium]
MRWLLILLVSCMAVTVCGCHQDNDEYMTVATVRLDGGEGVRIERVQAMAHFTNLNSRHVTSTANFDGAEVQVVLLRGAYQVLVEGVLSYVDADGKRMVRSFRAVSDYVELAGIGTSQAKMDIILLD